jgi:acetoacetate decarboxylase
MSQKTVISCVLLLVFSSVSLAQVFDNTNLSSTKPYYDDLPYVFEGSKQYYITFKTNPEAIKALVPAPLKPVSDSMTLLFAKHRIISPSRVDYHEAYFVILVSYGMRFGAFIPVLWLDKIETITPAREIWGYNKVGGEFEFIEKDNEMTVIVSQMDTLLMKATFNLGESFVPSEQPPGGSVFNVKFIPSVVEGAKPDVWQITASELKDKHTSSMRTGSATLEFYPSFFNPLDKIPVLEITRAGCTLDSFSMIYGEVLHDYLKEE